MLSAYADGIAAVIRRIVVILVMVASMIAIILTNATEPSAPNKSVPELSQELVLCRGEGSSQDPCVTHQEVTWNLSGQPLCKISMESYDAARQEAVYKIVVMGCSKVTLQKAIDQSGDARKVDTKPDELTLLDGRDIRWRRLLYFERSPFNKATQATDFKDYRKVAVFVTESTWSKYRTKLVSQSDSLITVQVKVDSPAAGGRYFKEVPDPKRDALGLVSIAIAGRIWEGALFTWPKCGGLSSTPM